MSEREGGGGACVPVCERERGGRGERDRHTETERGVERVAGAVTQCMFDVT